MIWAFPSRWEACALRHKWVLHRLDLLLLSSIYNDICLTWNQSFFDSGRVRQFSLFNQTKMLGRCAWFIIIMRISVRATDHWLDAIIGWGSDIHERDFWPLIDTWHLPFYLSLCYISDILSEHVFFLMHAEINLICRFAIYFLTHRTFFN